MGVRQYSPPKFFLFFYAVSSQLWNGIYFSICSSFIVNKSAFLIRSVCLRNRKVRCWMLKYWNAGIITWCKHNRLPMAVNILQFTMNEKRKLFRKSRNQNSPIEWRIEYKHSQTHTHIHTYSHFIQFIAIEIHMTIGCCKFKFTALCILHVYDTVNCHKIFASGNICFNQT